MADREDTVRSIGELGLSHDLAARPAGINGVHGGLAAQSPFLCHARRLLRSPGASFLALHNWRVILPNRRVRTRTHGGVTGKASDRIPMAFMGFELRELPAQDVGENQRRDDGGIGFDDEFRRVFTPSLPQVIFSFGTAPE